jgi:DNA-binding MarR family transcriptional regulator
MTRSIHSETIDFLLANVCHLHRMRAHQLLEALGLYQGQPLMLRELWQKEGLTQTEIAGRLSLAPATVTRMLQRMEKAGFILRKSDPQDQRVSRVYLSENGRRVQVQVEAVWKTMEAETFANLNLEERLLLGRLLQQIRQNLMEVTGEAAWA